MNIAIIVAGGVGKRMNLGFNKVFAEVRGKPILAYTIENFERCPDIDKIVVAAGNPKDGTDEEDRRRVGELLSGFGFTKVSEIVSGGETRMLSVENGLLAANPADDDIVLIQDGGRPFTQPELISEMIAAAKVHGAAICGLMPKDTIQVLDEEGFCVDTFDRSKLAAIYTPTVAAWGLIREAREKANSEGYLNTAGFEDSAILQKYGVRVKLVPCDYTNFKITTSEDLKVAENIISASRSLRT